MGTPISKQFLNKKKKNKKNDVSYKIFGQILISIIQKMSTQNKGSFVIK